MARCRALISLALVLGATLTQATDFRLIVASDDPGTRKSPALVIFEGHGKLSKDDRITSITFSAAAEMKPNCLVSLDPASGKASLALSPDVEVYQGKVMIAGSKPTKKVIPAHLEIDVPIAGAQPGGKLGSVMKPIIQQVNNLPWIYIGGAVGLFMMIMFVMNRRSQQYTTSMSKEAKNLYLETVGRITERLDNIEANQRNLVKNPPVIRTFRAQIEDFEGRLNRIEKIAKESHSDLLQACNELAKGGDRYQNITVKLDESKAEAAKINGALKMESDALRAELKLVLSSQDAAMASLGKLDHLETDSHKLLEHAKGLESKLADLDAAQAKAQADAKAQLEALMAQHQEAMRQAQEESMQKLQALSAELQILRANQESMMAMPQQIELVSASLANGFDSIQTAMPSLEGWDERFSGFGTMISDFGSKMDSQWSEVSSKLEGLPEIKNSIDALPNYHESLDRIHDSILRQIEDLGGKVEDRGAQLSELISAHTFAAPVAEPEAHVEAPIEAKKSRKSKAERKSASEEATEKEPSARHEEQTLEAAVDLEPVAEPVNICEPEAASEVEAAIDASLPEESPAEMDSVPVADLEAVDAESEATAEEPATLESTDSELAVDDVVDIIEPESVVEEQEAEVIFLDGAIDPDSAEQAQVDDAAELESGPVQVEEVKPMTETAEDSLVAEAEEVAQSEATPQRSLNDLPFVDEAVAHVEIEQEVASVAPISPDDAEDGKQRAFHVVEQLSYRYADDVSSMPEFHFNNAIERIAKEEPAAQVDEQAPAPISTFHLEDLPDHLDTFEDDDADAVLPTLHVIQNDSILDPEAEAQVVESVLKVLETKKPEDELQAFDSDSDAEPELDAHTGHWLGMGGSCARAWSSESSRTLNIVSLEGDLKPLTPIETAPIGDEIGSIAYGFGRVIYTCGSNVHGFWPGRDNRIVSLDGQVPQDEWRLAIRGQNLFVAEQKKVKILSLQGWFVLEQFSGEYLDQLLTENRWIGLRSENDQALLDFRDFRGGMSKQGVKIDAPVDSLKLCAGRNRIFAGASDGQVKEITEFGAELLGTGPEGSELIHLAAAEDGPVAIYRHDGHLEAWYFGEQTRWAPLETSEMSSHPVIMGGKVFAVDLANSEVAALNLKKMSVGKFKAFEGVSSLRRLVGIQHRSSQSLIAVTCDAGRKGGRLLVVDAKTGDEVKLGAVGQDAVNLICADHHIVLSTSSAYQNVIRVLEPFSAKSAA